MHAHAIETRASALAELAPPASEPSRGMIVASEPMRGVRRTLDVAAGFESTVLILGETGVGKEVAARRVHEKSRRACGPFVAVDCTTLTDSLMESQLFGHAKGAFTGADREAKGFVRAADGGTLFLDEIGELSLAAQAKLLRVLQERAVTPIGATRAVPVNIRVVAATHRDLKQMVDQGKFRQDLFFRLNVVRVTIPGLRQRVADIVPLAEHLLSMLAASYEGRAKSLSADACSMLMGHDWPGNVRELANAMEHAFIFSSGDTIEACDLPDSVHRSPTDDVLNSSLADDELATLAACEVSAEDDGDIDAPDAADAAAAVDEVLSIADGGVVPLHVAERELIRRALAQSGGLQSRAAELLQIERRRLYRKVRAYGLGSLTMRGQSA